MNADLLERVPPHNLEAERSVLGAILLDNDAIESAREIITIRDFYLEGHRKIFTAMIELSEHGRSIDAITLTEALRGMGALDAIGGPAYFAELGDCEPTALNITSHAGIVRRLAMARALASAGMEMASAAYDSPSDVDGVIRLAEGRVAAIRERQVPPEMPPAFRTATDYLAAAKERETKRHLWKGVLREGESSLLVGRAYAGKSTFASALTRAHRVGSTLLGRQCVAASVGYMALERNGLTVARLFETWGIGDVNFLDEVPPMRNDRLAQYLESEIKRLGLEIVIVDHLQNLVRVGDANDYAVVSKALEPFHKVAKHTSCHLMLLHHQPKTRREGEIDAMGSEAYRAAADALLEVTCSDGRHYIRGAIRGEPDLPKTLLTINLETGEVEGVEAREAELTAAKTATVSFLESQSEAVTADVIRDRVHLNLSTVLAALKVGIESGLLERTGEGKRGDPYLYQKAGFFSQSAVSKARKETGKVPEPTRAEAPKPFPRSAEMNPKPGYLEGALARPEASPADDGALEDLE
jgi:hypothetical protein